MFMLGNILNIPWIKKQKKYVIYENINKNCFNLGKICNTAYYMTNWQSSVYSTTMSSWCHFFCWMIHVNKLLKTTVHEWFPGHSLKNRIKAAKLHKIVEQVTYTPFMLIISSVFQNVYQIHDHFSCVNVYMLHPVFYSGIDCISCYVGDMRKDQKMWNMCLFEYSNSSFLKYKNINKMQ